MPTVTLRSPDGRTQAEFVPEANLLCCSLRHDGSERLAQRRGLEAYRERGKTMGIPLLHPWANRLAGYDYRAAGRTVTLSHEDPRLPHEEHDLPIHGVLPALLRWELLGRSSAAAAGHELEARLAWEDPALLELFPFPHELRVRASVGTGTLRIETELRPTGSDPAPVSFGYHPYLRLPDGPRGSCRIELAARERLVLDGQGIPTGEREPVRERAFVLAGRSFDEGLADLGERPRFTAQSAGGEVRVEFLEGYRWAQLFAPAGEPFVCFEPMTAPANALRSGEGLEVVAPGGSYRAAFRVRLD
jgi:galactose mutarotase-like enzyme